MSFIFSISTCKATDILRVYSNGWINLLMPFESAVNKPFEGISKAVCERIAGFHLS